MVIGLTQGCFVEYVLLPEDVDAVHVAKHPIPQGRAICALVVGVVDEAAGVVDLTLFPNWSKDGFVLRGSALPKPWGIAWREDVKHSDENIPGTWHFAAHPNTAKKEAAVAGADLPSIVDSEPASAASVPPAVPTLDGI